MPKRKLGFDLILLGEPTSGKDTQANILKKKYLLNPVESGKFSRELAKKNTAEGRLLRRTMEKGWPTPTKIMQRYIRSCILKAKKNQNLIFVANPRLYPEAKMVNNMLTNEGRNYLVLFIKIPKTEIFRRVRARLSIQSRPDDSQMQFLKNRISWQDPKTSKAVKYFESLNKVKFINGNRTIPQVAKEIQKTIDDYSRSERN